MGPLETNFNEILIKIIYVEGIAYDNIVSNMTTFFYSDLSVLKDSYLAPWLGFPALSKQPPGDRPCRYLGSN